MEQNAGTSWSLKVLGFVLGFALGIAFEFLLILIISDVSGHTIIPRGLGLLVLPFAAGFAGSAFLSERLPGLFNGSREMRQYVAGGASWFLLVMTWAFSARNVDEEVVIKLLIIPPVLALIMRSLFRWASKKDVDQPSASLPPSPEPVSLVLSNETAQNQPMPEPAPSMETLNPEQAKADLAELSRRISQLKGAAG